MNNVYDEERDYNFSINKRMSTFKVSGEFRFDLNENWNKLDVLSVEDKLIGLEYVLISK